MFLPVGLRRLAAGVKALGMRKRSQLLPGEAPQPFLSEQRRESALPSPSCSVWLMRPAPSHTGGLGTAPGAGACCKYAVTY